MIYTMPIYNSFFFILRVALEMVTQKNRDASICRKQSLLEEYLKNDALDIKDIMGMACDMLLAGVDTVSFQWNSSINYTFYMEFS